jgi:hypothetical protein
MTSGFQPKKAFLVTVILPDDWRAEDVVTACNIGVKKQSLARPELEIGAMSFYAQVIEEFKLRLP